MRGPLNLVQNLFEPVRATWTGSNASVKRISGRHSQYKKQLRETRGTHVSEAATETGKAWAQLSHGSWGALAVGMDFTTSALAVGGAAVGGAVGTTIRATGSAVKTTAQATAKAGRWANSKIPRQAPPPPVGDLPKMDKWSGPLEGWHGSQEVLDTVPHVERKTRTAKEVVADTAKSAVKTTVGTAVEAGKLGKTVGSMAWRTRNDPLIQLGALGAGVAVASTSGKDVGKFTGDYKNKLQMVNSSTDGGGAFLYDQAPTQGHIQARGPEFDRIGAGGDLVFALHNLRNGG